MVLDDAVDIRELPRRLITLAWLRDEPERWCGRVWFDEFDLVLASSDHAVETVRQQTRQGRPPRAAPGRSAGDGQSGPFPGRGVGSPRRIRGLDVSDPLWAADRGDELGCHRPLGRLSLRARPPARPRAGRPPDAAAFPRRLGLGARRARRRGGPPVRAQGSADPSLVRSTSCGRSATRTLPPPRSTSATTTSSSPRTRSPRGWRGRWPCRSRRSTRPPIRSASALSRGVRITSSCSWPTHAGSTGGSSTTWRGRPETSPSTVANGRRSSSTSASSRARTSPTPSSRAITAPPTSCSMTTGTTCASRGSCRTACTTRWPVGRSSSRTGSTASRQSSMAPSRPTTRETSSSSSSTATSTTLTNASASPPMVARSSSPRHTLDRRARVLCEVAEPLAAARRGQQDRTGSDRPGRGRRR